MKKPSIEIQKLLLKAETSLNKRSQLEQGSAQLEATLSRKENQKITEKSQKSQYFLCQEVSNL
tara:strand:+ start:714 stop:902 length:189 start_codon:yes stop_codon:yes gene_type:complete